VSFVALSQVDKYEWDGDGQTAARQTQRRLEYDTYGNPTRVNDLGDLAKANDQRDERTEWVADTTNWLHRPKRTLLYDSDGTTLLREKWFYYDSQPWGVLGTKGLLTKEESRLAGNQGNAGNPTVIHTYDAFGNRLTTTDPRNCATTTVMDSTKTYPATVTTCLGYLTSFVHDDKFGVVTSQTNPNLQVTTSQYDTLGRLTKVTSPTETSTNGSVSYQYLDWGVPTDQRVVTLRTEEHGQANVLETEELFDGLGRVYQILSEGPTTEIIQTEALFDSRNLVTTQSAPHFSTETSINTQFIYDILGRQTRVNHPDATFAATSYSRGLVTITNERGKPRKKHFDAYGRLEKVEEINGPDTYTTLYEYDAAGSLLHVQNHLGHHTRMKYDYLGRKEAMCDPNIGSRRQWGS
jgi:YD repeat-containing protein